VIAGAMQPYFFPYLGYFQLIRACDVFVAFADVQFMQGGWVNRNRVLSDHRPLWFTLPVASDAIGLPISARRYADGDGRVRARLLRTLHNYRRAPHFDAAMAVIEPLLANPEDNVAAYNTHLLRALSAHLGIGTRILTASDLPPFADLRGEARVIAMCQALGASTYVNSIGGVSLYSREAFARAGIELRFLRSEVGPYPQFGREHVASLSIIDVLMFNDAASIRRMLDQYTLVDG
jgi:hypothetical protein